MQFRSLAHNVSAMSSGGFELLTLNNR